MDNVRKTFAVYCADREHSSGMRLLELFSSRESADACARYHRRQGAYVVDHSPLPYVASVEDVHRVADRTHLRDLETLTQGEKLCLRKTEHGLDLVLADEVIGRWDGDRNGSRWDGRVMPHDLWSWVLEAVCRGLGVAWPLPQTFACK
jgi:hypothetical protein